ncbi:hypothetical protein PPERSA_08750 [Pseudocohnilembus persalinus]|uniref:Uncharacterized protein n=1 Tax=Pseudocohnilembus persalinus TaxID=266149 RepID=A0A0V0R7W7_PSEPJ|nr:hypothetical protein PPERSA_08750 [Pseudocohnilembus persalinus]|eukprot:KRX10448.1 hypothetical protein PPERSA_08750 [Pseudocohnilembus persalinus]
MYRSQSSYLQNFVSPNEQLRLKGNYEQQKKQQNNVLTHQTVYEERPDKAAYLSYAEPSRKSLRSKPVWEMTEEEAEIFNQIKDDPQYNDKIRLNNGHGSFLNQFKRNPKSKQQFSPSYQGQNKQIPQQNNQKFQSQFDTYSPLRSVYQNPNQGRQIQNQNQNQNLLNSQQQFNNNNNFGNNALLRNKSAVQLNQNPNSNYNNSYINQNPQFDQIGELEENEHEDEFQRAYEQQKMLNKSRSRSPIQNQNFNNQHIGQSYTQPLKSPNFQSINEQDYYGETPQPKTSQYSRNQMLYSQNQNQPQINLLASQRPYNNQNLNESMESQALAQKQLLRSQKIQQQQQNFNLADFINNQTQSYINNKNQPIQQNQFQNQINNINTINEEDDNYRYDDEQDFHDHLHEFLEGLNFSNNLNQLDIQNHLNNAYLNSTPLLSCTISNANMTGLQETEENKEELLKTKSCAKNLQVQDNACREDLSIIFPFYKPQQQKFQNQDESYLIASQLQPNFAQKQQLQELNQQFPERGSFQPFQQYQQFDPLEDNYLPTNQFQRKPQFQQQNQFNQNKHLNQSYSSTNLYQNNNNFSHSNNFHTNGINNNNNLYKKENEQFSSYSNYFQQHKLSEADKNFPGFHSRKSYSPAPNTNKQPYTSRLNYTPTAATSNTNNYQYFNKSNIDNFNTYTNNNKYDNQAFSSFKQQNYSSSNNLTKSNKKPFEIPNNINESDADDKIKFKQQNLNLNFRLNLDKSKQYCNGYRTERDLSKEDPEKFNEVQNKYQYKDTNHVINRIDQFEREINENYHKLSSVEKKYYDMTHSNNKYPATARNYNTNTNTNFNYTSNLKTFSNNNYNNFNNNHSSNNNYLNHNKNNNDISVSSLGGNYYNRNFYQSTTSNAQKQQKQSLSPKLENLDKKSTQQYQQQQNINNNDNQTNTMNIQFATNTGINDKTNISGYEEIFNKSYSLIRPSNSKNKDNNLDVQHIQATYDQFKEKHNKQVKNQNGENEPYDLGYKGQQQQKFQKILNESTYVNHNNPKDSENKYLTYEEQQIRDMQTQYPYYKQTNPERQFLSRKNDPTEQYKLQKKLLQKDSPPLSQKKLIHKKLANNYSYIQNKTVNKSSRSLRSSSKKIRSTSRNQNSKKKSQQNKYYRQNSSSEDEEQRQYQYEDEEESDEYISPEKSFKKLPKKTPQPQNLSTNNTSMRSQKHQKSSKKSHKFQNQSLNPNPNPNLTNSDSELEPKIYRKPVKKTLNLMDPSFHKNSSSKKKKNQVQKSAKKNKQAGLKKRHNNYQNNYENSSDSCYSSDNEELGQIHIKMDLSKSSFSRIEPNAEDYDDNQQLYNNTIDLSQQQSIPNNQFSKYLQSDDDEEENYSDENYQQQYENSNKKRKNKHKQQQYQQNPPEVEYTLEDMVNQFTNEDGYYSPPKPQKQPKQKHQKVVKNNMQLNQNFY